MPLSFSVCGAWCLGIVTATAAVPAAIADAALPVAATAVRQPSGEEIKGRHAVKEKRYKSLGKLSTKGDQTIADQKKQNW